MKKEELGIYQYKDEIISTIRNNQVTVVEAPTGSGKTTQIPQILFNAGMNEWDIIGVTQPRRIAAFGVSSRIAYEMGVKLGQLVGYKMRFDDMTSPNTRIKIMTDGILLEELRGDPLLSKYSIIMVDEAHERSLNIDFILGLLKDILIRRKDFKVVVSSATINAKLFSEYFGNAPVISVKTQQYSVDVRYTPVKNEEDLVLQKISEIVFDIESRKMKGDILIFLPGEASIKDCCEMLSVMKINNGFATEILPLYSRLSHEEQTRVFDEMPGKRKIVVATNIAETSITIDGIMHVIDPGVSKLNYYNPRTFTSFLEAKPISRASCDQRKGRAGRTAPGTVYRLYSEQDYANREEYTKEEIYRTDLSEVVLRMADLGINNYLDFDFISPPSRGAIFSAIETLILIGALDKNNRLTDIGKKMVDFPIEPRLARILLESILVYPTVTDNIVIVISFLSAKTPFLYPHGEEIESRRAQKQLMVNGGDFFSWINLFFRYKKSADKELFCRTYYIDLKGMNEIVNIHDQLCDMLSERGYHVEGRMAYDDITKCICAGLKQYICKKDLKKRNTYFSMTERDIRIHPGSLLYGETPDWIVGGEIVNTGRTYIRTAAVISEKVIRTDLRDVHEAMTRKVPLKTRLPRSVKEKPKEKAEENRIYILDKYFDIHRDNKGSFVNVPYNIIIQLKSRKEKLLGLDFGKLQAKLVFRDVLILKDRLNSLLLYFDKIDLDNGLNVKWPKNQVFLYPDDWLGIFKNMKNIMTPTLPQKKSKSAGFLCLTSEEGSGYSYYLEKDFFNALERSVDTMEKLFGSEVQAWNEKEKLVMETIYHKLMNLAEEMEI